MTADVVCTKIYIHYFTLDSLVYSLPPKRVCFSSLATSHICIILKNKINEALFSPSLSYILNYSQYYSTWFMDSIYSHFPLNLPFVFTITLVLPFSFLITTENVFYIPQKTFDFSMIEQFITVLMRFCWVQNNDFNNSGLFLVALYSRKTFIFRWIAMPFHTLSNVCLSDKRRFPLHHINSA